MDEKNVDPDQPALKAKTVSYFSLTVKVATLKFISGCGSAISSA